MTHINDNSLKETIRNDYNNQVRVSNIVETESGNLFRYNYVCRMLLCVTNNETVLAQKMLDVNEWLHNPRKEILSWESELVLWN